MKEIKLEKLLFKAGLMIIVGLVIATISILWISPISFVIFTAGSGLLIAVGIIFYLYGIATYKPEQIENAE